MPEKPLSVTGGNRELRKDGGVVGETDRVYQVTGASVTFDEVLVKGDLSGDLTYNGRRLRVVRVDTMIGLEIGPSGARGPMWKAVECQVLG